MKNFKKIIALVLVALMVLSFTACHKKGATAVTVGEVEFSAGYYACALVNAYTEGTQKVYESLTDEEKNNTSLDYSSKEIDGKKFNNWVEDTAVDYLKNIAAYKTLAEENKLKIDQSKNTSLETSAEYYWTSYGYSAYFIPNNVAKETYIQYMKDTYYSELYFEHLYGAEGEKAISAEDAEAKIYDNFLIANVLEASYTSDTTDTEKAEMKAKLEGYMEELKNSSRSFEAIYKEYKSVDDEETTSAEADEDAPKDKYASLLGAEDTNYASTYYDDIKAMAIGEIKLIELEDESGLALVVKQDIKADEYYKTSLDMDARHLIADEEYKDDIEEYAEKLEAKVHKSVTRYLKAKDIVMPTSY